MKVLATAKPNEKYIQLQSIHDIILEARLINNKVHYFETHSKNKNWVVELSEETINSLFVFETEISLNDRPFLYSENIDFWFVLNRKGFPEEFQRLKRKSFQEE